MAEPIAFPSTTANAGLPLLFSGQSQKEFSLNQALETIDALWLRSVEAVLDAPPTDPQAGQCFLIASGATNAWEGRADQIVMRLGETWHFIMPKEGLQIYDRASGQALTYQTQWLRAATPEAPIAGAVIDEEARAAIMGLITALQNAGILTGSA